jgi:hypothetical protein
MENGRTRSFEIPSASARDRSQVIPILLSRNRWPAVLKLQNIFPWLNGERATAENSLEQFGFCFGGIGARAGLGRLGELVPAHLCSPWHFTRHRFPDGGFLSRILGREHFQPLQIVQVVQDSSGPDIKRRAVGASRFGRAHQCE